MNDDACAALLAWVMPMLGLRWRGFVNVRRQVCRRVVARARERGCADLAAYRAVLEAEPREREVLDGLCFVTISRFYRDAQVFGPLAETLLPRIAEEARARGETTLRVWSAGCASGEEPYTFAILWHLELAARFPDLALDLLATDRDEAVLGRARAGEYDRGTLRELPAPLLSAAFGEGAGGRLRLHDRFRAGVRFHRADIRTFTPEGPLHLALCRNSAFTYFDRDTAGQLAQRLAQRLVPGGLLVLGKRETFPADPLRESAFEAFEECAEAPYVFRRIPAARVETALA